jgi:beta-mannosidase
MRWHDKTAKGYETYLGYIALHYPEPQTVEELVYYGQCNQADGMRFGIEHFRRLRPRNMGTLVWQLNDCWPVQSWAWVDYRLRPKAAWYAAKRFYAPLLVSLWCVPEETTAHVHLVNDDAEPVSGRLVLRAVDAAGTERWRHELDASVEGRGSQRVVDVELPADIVADRTSIVLHATFAGTAATALLCEPRDLTIAAPNLDVSATDTGLLVRTDTTAVSLELWLDGTDARWSDNFVTLLPGETLDLDVTPATPLTNDELLAAVRWQCVNRRGATSRS